MTRLSLAFVLAVGLLFGAAAQADAANSFIVVRGFAHYQVPGCTVISQGGNIFSLHGASPAIPYNVGVTVVGTKSGDVSICFGIPLKVVKWTRNRLRCALN
jgi:hypothetical protein